MTRRQERGRPRFPQALTQDDGTRVVHEDQFQSVLGGKYVLDPGGH